MIAQLQGTNFPLSPEDYLPWEAGQNSKYEYERGTIIAMTGGKVPHSQVIANFSALLVPHLQGKKCKVAVSDAKVRISPERYYYPDVIVSCDERDRGVRDYLSYPRLIAEVISPSTEARDRGIKQQNYMKIATLNSYLLVDSDRFQVELYERQQSAWKYILIDSPNIHLEDPIVAIADLELEFPLSVLYDNIDRD